MKRGKPLGTAGIFSGYLTYLIVAFIGRYFERRGAVDIGLALPALAIITLVITPDLSRRFVSAPPSRLLRDSGIVMAVSYLVLLFSDHMMFLYGSLAVWITAFIIFHNAAARITTSGGPANDRWIWSLCNRHFLGIVFGLFVPKVISLYSAEWTEYVGLLVAVAAVFRFQRFFSDGEFHPSISGRWVPGEFHRDPQTWKLLIISIGTGAAVGVIIFGGHSLYAVGTGFIGYLAVSSSLILRDSLSRTCRIALAAVALSLIFDAAAGFRFGIAPHLIACVTLMIIAAVRIGAFPLTSMVPFHGRYAIHHWGLLFGFWSGGILDSAFESWRVTYIITGLFLLLFAAVLHATHSPDE